MAVFLRGGSAENRGAFWLGWPGLAVEVMSPDDNTRGKLPFYATLNVRELLLVDRAPWSLALLRLTDGALATVGCATVENAFCLASAVLPFTFRLVNGPNRPQTKVVAREAGTTWLV